ncbi:hypothetical protein FO519_001760 [Halicephalobus sp. NKZ332]|nr:hypothetical protein FO519_001760 [Halicephalobus sp. NKZ332]
MNIFKCCQDLLGKRRERNAQSIDPWIFDEDNKKYRVWCGFFHVKHILIAFTIAKTILIMWYITSRLIQHKTGMITLVSCFGLVLLAASYAFLIIGVIIKKYTFVIPYFTICLMLILILAMKVFIEIMISANTRSTLEPSNLTRVIIQTCLIFVEIYSVTIVWRVFNYITDYYMKEEFYKNSKIAEQKRRLELDMEEGRIRRKERAERLKLLETTQVQRKPTFPQLAALMEEVKLLGIPEKRERHQSEVSVSSSDTN